MNKTLKRTISGAIFLAVVVGGLLASPYSFAAVMAFVMVCTTHEFFTMSVGKRFPVERACVLAVEILTFAGLFIFFNNSSAAGLKIAAASLVFLFTAFSLMLKDCGHEHLFSTDLFFPLVYILLPVCSTLPLSFCAKDGYEPLILLSVFILAWTNDVFAYVFGMRFGQKEGSLKLAPEISPKKSWAGVAGGTVFCFLAAALLWYLWGDRTFALVHWMVIAAITSSFGVLGDLFESLIKRHAMVKDAGNVIPGHGGFLDRFDDLFFVIPIVTAYLFLVSVL